MRVRAPRRRRAAAMVLGLAAGLALASPALADTPTVTWSDPAPTSVPGEAGPVAVVTRAGELRGVASHAAGIDSVAVSVTEDAGRPDEPCSAARESRPQVVPGRGQPQLAFAYPATFPCNQAYEVTATVTPTITSSHGRSEVGRSVLRVLVAIPPADVARLDVDREGDTSVRLRWPPASDPAPDFAGYELRRAVGEGGFEVLAGVGPDVTSFVDVVPPGRTHRYAVVAVRSGPRPDTVVYSAVPAVARVEVQSTTTTAVSPPGAQSVPAGVGVPSASPGSGGSSPTTARRTPPTTADTGFVPTLPFKRRPVAGAPVDEPATGSAVAILQEDEDDSGRQTLVLLAGGLNLLAGALVLRVVASRVGPA